MKSHSRMVKAPTALTTVIMHKVLVIFYCVPKKLIDGSKKCNDDNEFARGLLFDAKYFKPHGNLGYGNCLYHSISNFIVFYGDQPPTEWEKYKGNKGTVILTE